MRKETLFILALAVLAGAYRLMREAYPARSGSPDPVSFLTSARTDLISHNGEEAIYAVSPTTIGTTGLYRAWVVQYSPFMGYTALWHGWVADRKHVYAYWASDNQIGVTSFGSDYEQIRNGIVTEPISQVVMVE